METEDTFLINYGLIKACRRNKNQFKFEIFNPSYLNTMSIIITNIESYGLLMNKTLREKEIEILVQFFEYKTQNEIKLLIEHFVDFINLMRNEVESDIIKYLQEDRFYKAMFESRKYYERSMSELKEQEKVKINLKKRLLNNQMISIDKTLDNQTLHYTSL